MATPPAVCAKQQFHGEIGLGRDERGPSTRAEAIAARVVSSGSSPLSETITRRRAETGPLAFESVAEPAPPTEGRRLTFHHGRAFPRDDRGGDVLARLASAAAVPLVVLDEQRDRATDHPAASRDLKHDSVVVLPIEHDGAGAVQVDPSRPDGGRTGISDAVEQRWRASSHRGFDPGVAAMRTGSPVTSGRAIRGRFLRLRRRSGPSISCRRRSRPRRRSRSRVGPRPCNAGRRPRPPLARRERTDLPPTLVRCSSIRCDPDIPSSRDPAASARP